MGTPDDWASRTFTAGAYALTLYTARQRAAPPTTLREATLSMKTALTGPFRTQEGRLSAQLQAVRYARLALRTAGSRLDLQSPEVTTLVRGLKQLGALRPAALNAEDTELLQALSKRGGWVRPSGPSGLEERARERLIELLSEVDGATSEANRLQRAADAFLQVLVP